MSALTDVKIGETHDAIYFSDRAAYEVTASGKIDGVKAKIWLLVFKKNGCNFTLSYMGSAKSFDRERTAFEEFKKSVQVQQ
jgi:hypothetical protein